MRLRLRIRGRSRKRAAESADALAAEAPSVADLGIGEEGTLERIDLPEETAHRLMELGFLPGSRIVGAHRAPGGGPRVYRVDGSEVALRLETAVHLILRSVSSGATQERA
jgi:ferrous iron transport protein A